MKKIEKRLLTHDMCVRCNMSLLKFILSGFAISLIIAPLFLKIESVLFTMALIFCATSALCGIVFLLRTIKIDKKLKAGEYFIYLDKVSDKQINEENGNSTYLLKFKNNKYEKSVSQKVYQNTKPGTLYYLVQLENGKKALGAFAESDYALDDSVKPKFKNE